MLYFLSHSTIVMMLHPVVWVVSFYYNFHVFHTVHYTNILTQDSHFPGLSRDQSGGIPANPTRMNIPVEHNRLEEAIFYPHPPER